MVHRVNYFFITLSGATALLGLLFFCNSVVPTLALGQATPVSNPVSEHTSIALLDQTIFKPSDLSSVMVRPLFDDLSTNIAFYMKCPNVACPTEGTPENPLYIFSAENLGHGILPFSEYWDPPLPTDYVAIEYRNDDQQFTCSDKSISECKNDSRFISFFEFALVSEETPITSEMIVSKNLHLRPALSVLYASTTDLLSLSITLSSPFITSDLNNGQVVTALLDGRSETTGELTVAGTGTTTETDLRKLSIDLSAPFISSSLEDGQIITALLDGRSETTGELTVAGTTTETDLRKLSIDLSAPFISSNLDDGQIVTAILDNKPSLVTPVTPAPPAPPEEATDSHPVSDFIFGIIEAVIDVFTPESDEPVAPTEIEETEDIEVPVPAPEPPPAESTSESVPEESTPEPVPDSTAYETTPSTTE